MILDGGATAEERGLPWPLLELARIRSAARRIVEANLPPEDEAVLLGGLIKQAYTCALVEWALDLILVEVQGPDLEAPPPHHYVVAQERLARAKFESCPICLTPVLGEHHLDLLKVRERDAAAAAVRWAEVRSDA